jgi:hypothetical protein
MTALLKTIKIKEALLDFPLFILTSPFKGFDELKNNNRGSMLYAVVILIIHGFVGLWGFMGTGFVVSGFWWEYPSYNILYHTLYTYAPILLVCAANWSITSITNGNGRFKEILYVYCYALFLAVICWSISIILSNVVTANEIAFVGFFWVFGNVVLYFYLFIGLTVIHEFTFFKSVLMVILTIFAMLIIVFILMLFSSLVSELLFFVITLFTEVEAHLL